MTINNEVIGFCGLMLTILAGFYKSFERLRLLEYKMDEMQKLGHNLDLTMDEIKQYLAINSDWHNRKR